ncbi:MAG: hypothetical protein RLZ10_2682 [Bacteroidota bacterium]|jgi:phosphoglycolate phosphatase-like HAD superfamily hydrolase
MKKTILLDLDETLITTLFRQYSVIKTFFDQFKFDIANFDEYITFRKTNICSNQIFVNQFINDQYILGEFRKFYLENIEEETFLEKDKLIVDLNLLKSISKYYNLILVSLRSNKINSSNQLKQIELLNLFTEVHFSKHEKINSKIDVVLILKKKHSILSFVGDSKTDYEAALVNEIEFIGVETGLFPLSGKFRSFETINHYLNTLLAWENSVRKN